MKIGILGTGDVGQALGHGFLSLGHEVMLGSRQEGNAKAEEWAKRYEGKALTGNFERCAQFGEVIVVATLGTAAGHAVQMAGAAHFKGKLVIDTTNPLDFSKGFPPKLVGHLGDSSGERIQLLLPEAHVVKAFNTAGHALMFKPQLPGGPPDMFICGNDEGAKERMRGLLKDFGWNTVDVGGIESSHYLEAMCMVWVLAAARANRWGQAFKLLHT